MSRRRRRRTWLTLVVAAVLAVPTPAFAVDGTGGEGGGGAGSGAGETTGDAYSDLVRILREENGTPVLAKYVVPATAETPATTEYCVQPVSYQPAPGLVQTTNPADGSTVYRVPLQGEWLSSGTVPPEEVTACDPQPEYAMFVNEVELERLNMARTSDSVMDDKLAAVQTKLELGRHIALDPAGRISVDGVPIDAAPEQAAIYQSLMNTGSIPGLPEAMGSPTANIGPEATPGHNSRFDAWELAAAAVGTAASKGVPINIDTIEYYNQVIGFPSDAFTSPWGMHFVRPFEPGTGTEQTTGRRYVDYSGFVYNRADTFPGSVTWLDVADLEWQVTPILQAVPFTNPGIGTATLHGVRAFAQLADDTRAVISYLHEHEVVLPGFFMDPVGIDSTPAQQAAVRDPAVDLGTLPADVFATKPFGVTASLFNPHATTTVPEAGGQLIEHARLRITVHPVDGALESGDITASADGQQVPFEAQGGDLVGWWGPETGFPVPPGYHVSTDFEVTVGDGAPTGQYDVTLQLVDLDTNQVLAQDTGSTAVHADVPTLLWGGDVPAVATQGSYVAVPLRVHMPTAGTVDVRLGVTGPDNVTPATAQVAVYGSNEDGSAMVALPLAPEGTARVATTWRVSVPAGDTDLVWYLVVAPGAPLGGYALDAGLVGGVPLTSVLVDMTAPETNGESTSVAVKITVHALGADPSFTLTADPETATGTFQCRLGKDGEDAPWEDCGSAPTSEKAYSGLAPATYEFSARLKLGSARMSETASVSWVVPGAPGGDTTAPIVTVKTVGTPAADATFLLSSDDPTATFTCRLLEGGTTGGPWSACTAETTYTNLQPGTYTLEVKAVDLAGNESEIASTQWTVVATPPPPGGDDTIPPSGGGTTPSGGDTTAPQLVVTPTGVPGSTATFALGSDDPTATYACRLTKDGTPGAWEPCKSPVTYQALESGVYVLEVKASDPAGNVSSVVERTWTVAGQSAEVPAAPDTRVLAGPRDGAWVLAHSAIFRLGSDVAGAHYRVQVNNARPSTCTSSSCRVTGLAGGTYRIRFAAVVDGSVDRTPVTRFVSVPRGVLALAQHRRWQVGTSEAALFGRYAQTSVRGRSLTAWASRITRIALVVSTGPRAGSVDVYLGSRRLTRTPVHLASRIRHSRVVVPIATFPRPRQGLVRVVVTSRDRVVRIEGLGLTTR